MRVEVTGTNAPNTPKRAFLSLLMKGFVFKVFSSNVLIVCVHYAVSETARLASPCGVLVVSVVDGGEDTPGPFPNPEAKLTCADGTAHGSVWESRSPPA